MKKLSLVLIFALIAVFVIPTFWVMAEENTGVIAVSCINVIPKVNTVTVFTPDFGESTKTTEGNNVLEIAVSGGKVISMDGFDNEIPKDGFVVCVRGSGSKKEIASNGVKVGDRAIFDGYSMELCLFGENFSPFYENTVSFNAFNSTRSENTIIIYDKGEKTNTNIWGNEVVVNSDGVVISVEGNDSEIPDGGFVVSAVGKTRMAEIAVAKVGMVASLDRKNKTITFAYNEKSLLLSMKAGLSEFEKTISDMKSEFIVADYEKLYDILSNLSEIIEKTENFTEVSDILENKYLFSAVLGDAEKYTYEFPAVEARAMWLRPAGMNNDKAVYESVKSIHDAGYNIICLEGFYNSTLIFPIDSEKYLLSQDPSLGGYDVLAAFVRECHKFGMELYLWFPVYRVSHSSTTYKSLALSTIKPEWLCKSKNGTTDVGDTGGNFLNPALPEVSEYLLSLYKYIFENYAIDSFQLDYVRYPIADGEDYGYDDYTRNLFKEKYGKDPINMTSSDSLWETWCKFRASFVTEFVKKVSALAEEIRPDMYLSADVAPDFRDVYKKYMQEAEIWLEDDIIDIGFPMAYGTGVVPLYSSFTVNAAGNHAYSYIGLGDYGVDIYKREIKEARQAGGDGVAFFSWSQYTDGDYLGKIENTVFYKKAISQTFNSTEALKAELEYALKRADAVRSFSDKPDSAKGYEIIEKLISDIGNQTAKSAVNLIKNAQSEIENLNIETNAKKALEKETEKALKIATLSKDEEKAEYYKENPLPEKYGEEMSKEEVSAEESFSDESVISGENESKAVSETEENGIKSNTKTVVGIASAAIGVAVIAGAAMAFKKRKGRKK